jgi:hypothetical protein
MEGIKPQGAGAVLVLVSVVDCTGIVIVPIAAIEGPEKGEIPLNAPPRVSTRRQGVIATKVRAVVDTAFAENWSCGWAVLAVSRSPWLGCQ